MSIHGVVIGLIAAGGIALLLLAICMYIYCYHRQISVGNIGALALPFRRQHRVAGVQISVAKRHHSISTVQMSIASQSKIGADERKSAEDNIKTNVVAEQAESVRVRATGSERPGFLWLQSRMDELDAPRAAGPAISFGLDLRFTS